MKIPGVTSRGSLFEELKSWDKLFCGETENGGNSVTIRACGGSRCLCRDAAVRLRLAREGQTV